MAVIARSDDVRKGNRRRVLSLIRRGGPLSRTDIGRQSGLSAATVSAVVGDLLDAAALASGPPSADRASSGRGRPRVPLSVNPDAALVGVVTIRINRIDAAAFDYAGGLLAEHTETFPTRIARKKSLRHRLISCLKAVLVLAERPLSGLRRIAVGVQGTTDIDGQTMLWSPAVGQRGLPLGEWLADAFGVPVQVSNDCEMMAHALAWREPEFFGGSFATVLLSHGVGMSLFRSGRLIKGTQSSAMEFGHMIYLPDGALCRCGRSGCIEAYAGDYAIYRRASRQPVEASPTEIVHRRDLEAIVAAADSGDHDAREAIEAAGRALGVGLANLFALIDPVPIALVGNGTVAYEFLEEPMRQLLSHVIQVETAATIPIRCYREESPILQEGCAISALTKLDDEIANALPQLVPAVA